MNRAFFGLVATAMVVMFGLLVFVVADCALGDARSGIGKIVGKEYTPAHTDLISSVDSDRNVTLSDSYVSESWTVRVEFYGTSDTLSVDQVTYSKCIIGNHVTISYRIGKMSECKYLMDVDPSTKIAVEIQ